MMRASIVYESVGGLITTKHNPKIVHLGICFPHHDLAEIIYCPPGYLLNEAQ